MSISGLNLTISSETPHHNLYCNSSTVKMAAKIDAPGKCELRTVFCFLPAEGWSFAETHHRMTNLYGNTLLEMVV